MHRTIRDRNEQFHRRSATGAVEPGEQRLGCDASIGVADDLIDLSPVGTTVDSYAQPAAMANVGRSKELLAVLGDHFLLRTRWCRTPEAEVVNSVMVVVDGNELLRPADEESGRSVASAFDDFGQREAQLPKPVYGVACGRHPARLMRVPSICALVSGCVDGVDLAQEYGAGGRMG